MTQGIIVGLRRAHKSNLSITHERFAGIESGYADKPLQKERWSAAIDSVGSRTLANVCASRDRTLGWNLATEEITHQVGDFLVVRF